MQILIFCRAKFIRESPALYPGGLVIESYLSISDIKQTLFHGKSIRRTGINLSCILFWTGEAKAVKTARQNKVLSWYDIKPRLYRKRNVRILIIFERLVLPDTGRLCCGYSICQKPVSWTKFVMRPFFQKREQILSMGYTEAEYEKAESALYANA